MTFMAGMIAFAGEYEVDWKKMFFIDPNVEAADHLTPLTQVKTLFLNFSVLSKSEKKTAMKWNLPGHISDVCLLVFFSFLSNSSLQLLSTAGNFCLYCLNLSTGKICLVISLILFIYLESVTLANQACWCITDLFH